MFENLSSAAPSSPRARTATRAVGVAAAALIAVAGCSGVDTSSNLSPTAGSQAGAEPMTSTQEAPQTASSTSAPSASTSAGTSDSHEDLLRAGETALAKVDGTLTSIEGEDNGTRWEVQVVTSDGTEHEVELSADGKDVLRGPIAEHDDAADKAKRSKRVTAAKIDFRKAAEIMAGVVPDGRITELDLDSHNGQTVWEGNIVVGSQTKHEVRIDAGTGKVLQNQPDH